MPIAVAVVAHAGRPYRDHDGTMFDRRETGGVSATSGTNRPRDRIVTSGKNAERGSCCYCYSRRKHAVVHIAARCLRVWVCDLDARGSTCVGVPRAVGWPAISAQHAGGVPFANQETARVDARARHGGAEGSVSRGAKRGRRRWSQRLACPLADDDVSTRFRVPGLLAHHRLPTELRGLVSRSHRKLQLPTRCPSHTFHASVKDTAEHLPTDLTSVTRHRGDRRRRGVSV